MSAAVIAFMFQMLGYIGRFVARHVKEDTEAHERELRAHAHAAHTTHAAHVRHATGRGFVLQAIPDHAPRWSASGSHGSGVLQRSAGHLGGVQDAHFDHVAVLPVAAL